MFAPLQNKSHFSVNSRVSGVVEPARDVSHQLSEKSLKILTILSWNDASYSVWPLTMK